MATHALIDASIDSFWAAAGVACPAAKGRKSRSAVPKLPQQLGQGYGQGPGQLAKAAKPKVNDALGQEFKKVTVEITGREGYNSAAVNGVWYFWKVKNGRLAFNREIQLDTLEAVDEESDTSPRRETPSPQVLRLFLFYVVQTDAWIISDAADFSGNVIADCGPCQEGSDFDQTWRVWDGDGWKEDDNISAEIHDADILPMSAGSCRRLTVGPPLSARGPPRAALRPREDHQLPLTSRRRTPRQLDAA